MSTPATIPPELRAGDTWQWTRSFSAYPADDGWTLITIFRRGNDREDRQAAGVADGADFLTTVDASDTQNYPPGRYLVLERATKAGEVRTAGQWEIKVLPDLADLTIDVRSHDERCLEALLAVKENRATTDQISMTIDDTAISRMSWDELEGAYLRYKRRVDRARGIDVDQLHVRM